MQIIFWIIGALFLRFTFGCWLGISNGEVSPIEPFALFIAFVHCSVAVMIWYGNYVDRKQQKKSFINMRAFDRRSGLYDKSTLNARLEESIKEFKDNTFKGLFWGRVCLLYAFVYVGLIIWSLLP
jgi:hypothetical protein